MAKAWSRGVQLFGVVAVVAAGTAAGCGGGSHGSGAPRATATEVPAPKEGSAATVASSEPQRASRPFSSRPRRRPSLARTE